MMQGVATAPWGPNATEYMLWECFILAKDHCVGFISKAGKENSNLIPLGYISMPLSFTLSELR